MHWSQKNDVICNIKVEIYVINYKKSSKYALCMKLLPKKAKICKHAGKKYDYSESLSHKMNICKVWEV